MKVFTSYAKAFLLGLITMDIWLLHYFYLQNENWKLFLKRDHLLFVLCFLLLLLFE